MVYKYIFRPQSIDTLFVVILFAFMYTLIVPSHIFHERYVIIKSIILRGIAFITGLALISYRMQCEGLFGDKGLYPLSSTLQTMRKFIIEKNSSNIFSIEYAMRGLLSLVYEKFSTKREYSKQLLQCLHIDIAACFIGFLWPHPIICLYLYFSYYGYKRISGPFLNFQWDALLLESLFFSIPLALSNAPWMDAICICLFRFLLFRLMFGSGLVKAYGRDTSWHTQYSAMSYHFLTQPLPNQWGRLLHIYAPPFIFTVMTHGTLIAELILPLLSLVSHPWINAFVAAGYLGLMLSIAFTGYYGMLVLFILFCYNFFQTNLF